MNYSVPFQKILSLVNKEVNNSHLTFMLNIPIEIQHNEMFLFIKKQFIFNILQNSKLTLQDISSHDFYYQSLPFEIQEMNKNFLESIVNIIENNKKNVFSASFCLDMINYEAKKQQTKIQARLHKYSYKVAINCLNSFDNPEQYLYCNFILNNIFSDEEINIDLGSEDEIPDKFFQSYGEISKFFSILVRPNYPEYIIIQSNSTIPVVNALLPGSVKIDKNEIFESDFSFKNEIFLNSNNENILNKIFLEVSSIDNILDNIDTYLEDLNFFAKQHGNEHYIDALIFNNLISVFYTPNLQYIDNKDFSQILKDFYHFISIIPLDILHNGNNLEKISEKLSKKFSSINNFAFTAPNKRLAGKVNYDNFEIIDDYIISKTPFSIDKITSYYPDSETIEKIKTKTPGNFQNIGNFNILNEIYLQNFTIDDIKNLLKGVDKQKWLNIILIVPYAFHDDIYKIPLIKYKLEKKLLASIETSLSKQYIEAKANHLTNDDLKKFINSLDIHEHDKILNTILTFIEKSNFKDDNISNVYKENNKIQFRLKKEFEVYSRISLIDTILSSKKDLLINIFVSYIYEFKNDDQNNFIKQKIYESLINLSKFLLQIKNIETNIFSSNENSDSKLVTNTKNFDNVREFFLFNVFNEYLHKNIIPSLSKSFFYKNLKNHMPRKMEKNPEFYISYIENLHKKSPELIDLYADYINMDYLFQSKYDFTTLFWFKFLQKKGIYGDAENIIQKLITKSGSNIEKLKQCQNIIIMQFTDCHIDRGFKTTPKVLLELENKPELANNLIDMCFTFSSAIEKLSNKSKYNPAFWISLASSYQNNINRNSDLFFQLFDKMDKCLYQDKNLLIELLPLYQKATSSFNSSNEINFIKKYENYAIPLFKKPKYLLQMVEQFSTGNITQNTLQNLNPELFKFIQDNKIKSEHIFQTINSIIQQSIIENDMKKINVKKDNFKNKHKF